MYIWLIAEGEDLPVMQNARLMRMGALASFLARNGHKVIWWSSSFIHGSKEYYSKEYREIEVSENELLILLHSKISYHKNISFRRIVYHKLLALEFRKRSREKAKPDIILCAWPTPQFAEEAVRYGKTKNIPVVIDSRDMWPDIYERAIPDWLKCCSKIFLFPLKRNAAKTFKRADGITGMIRSELEWACRYAGRTPGKFDETIFIGNEKVQYTQEEIYKSIEWWNDKGVKSEDWIICFFSTFGAHIAVDTVIRAVIELSEKYNEIKIVLGGGGDREKELRSIAGNNNNVVFAGWLDNLQMTSLMKIAKCGAFSIKNTFDFIDTFNNKAIQYISEGLPILNSLSGFAKTFINENDMGLTYDCESVSDCKGKILKLYLDEERRAQMGQNGLKCFNERFDSNVVNRQFEKYLLRVKSNYKKDYNK